MVLLVDLGPEQIDKTEERVQRPSRAIEPPHGLTSQTTIHVNDEYTPLEAQDGTLGVQPAPNRNKPQNERKCPQNMALERRWTAHFEGNDVNCWKPHLTGWLLRPRVFFSAGLEDMGECVEELCCLIQGVTDFDAESSRLTTSELHVVGVVNSENLLWGLQNWDRLR